MTGCSFTDKRVLLMLKHIGNPKFFVPLRKRIRTFMSSSMNNSKDASPDLQRVEKDYFRIKRLRFNAHMKTDKYVPSIISVQVLGSGARGEPASLFVSTDHSKYLFNCGEGTQRLAHEHRSKITKLDNMFITTPIWKNIGGLPGVVLTLQEVGIPNVTLHGPKGILDVFNAQRRFITLKNLNVGVADVSQPYEDGTMKVEYVPILKDCNGKDKTKHSTEETTDKTEEIYLDDIDYYAHETNSNRKRPTNQGSFSRKRNRKTPFVIGSRITSSMAYICSVHPKPGKLSLGKCVDKGVPAGPLLGKLKAGEEVTLEDGTVVKSSDVCDPPQPGPVFIVVECPTEWHVNSLVDNPIFEKHQVPDTNETAFVVFHFTPETTLQDQRYQSWMKKFPQSTKHVILNDTNLCMASEATHKHQHMLHLIHPEVFPFLDESGFQPEESRESNENQEPTDSALQLHRARTMDTVHLRPLQGLDISSRVSLHPKEYVEEVFEIKGFLDELAELQTKVANATKNLSSEEYPKLVMLGTGSCIPNKIRNTSGILLRFDESTSMLMDCGEGTLEQMVKFYGKSEVDSVLATIKAIYVSHLHADHHIGLIGILLARAKVNKNPVYLLAPEQIRSWLELYDKRFESIGDCYTLISNDSITEKMPMLTPIRLKLYESLGVKDITTVPVDHCPFSFGVRVVHQSGHKVVYSGDTRPCQDLVKLAKDCDVLIHEATMEDELKNEANKKLHSTISQAINVGVDANAKFTLLTHFSQRYTKIPRLPTDEKGGTKLDNVGIAYDNMQIKLSQISLLPLFYPSLLLMFSEFYTLLEEKASKRKRKLMGEFLLSEKDDDDHQVASNKNSGCR